ncbi:Na+/H+ antiporter subunit A [Kytococcus sp. HMSC28H12]|uniref:Na+/H+ antiporter subunit A n=1 Tax=Kytococcus sp. HMSC28H12 TaxID=1581067 RepID=UPI0008A64680|nr:Na+/H+ antiporter subunit A [Kytococcus sp. HMSC28H12]OFS06264.1 Na+/H+ antiporter subunit A [Kytococcus sp. HMSC28H12]
MFIAIALHLLAALLAPLGAARLGRRVFPLLALVPAGTAVWALTRSVAARGDAPPVETVPWVPSLDLELAFRLDPLAWLMVLVVGAVGAMVLTYCTGCFEDDEKGLGRFAACLVGFAGAMVGLVTADDVLVLYLFWEVTTVLSYLLIGHSSQRRASRVAAGQALVVTTFGGLAMLAGLLLLARDAGTHRLSELVAHPPAATLTTSVAVVLVLLGVASKSAQVPFHFWLPAAMAAPTPVSAFLHAAAMVKAGVYLVARLAPALADVPVWRWLLVLGGALTMLLGAWRAMRQVDLKLLLAHGTVSQLGFLCLVLGVGNGDAALAGVALLVAHALFKSSLFLAVGVVDHATGTRDLRLLRGLRRSMPWTFWTCVLALASMAGIPPLYGFVAKEAALGALEHGGPTPGDGFSTLALVAVVLGSALTVAYSGRFLVLGLGDHAPGTDERPAPSGPTPVGHVSPWAVAVPVVLAEAGLLLAPFAGRVEHWLAPAAGPWPATPDPVHLALVPHVGVPLALTGVVLLVGGALVLAGRPVARWAGSLPQLLSAQRGYRWTMRTVERGANELTGHLQRGSLELNLALVFGTFVLLPGWALATGVAWPERVRLADGPAQVGTAVVVALAAVAAARSRRRLRGVFLVGVTGYGVAMLFLLHGAPDLALTQVLVETVSIAVFVLVLRHLPVRFRDFSTPLDRRLRWLLGAAVGTVMCLLAVTASAVRTAPHDPEALAERAKTFGGGTNIVNVILVDIRAWDTMGELSVVLVAATGVASLVFLHSERVTTSYDRVRDALGRRRSHAAVSEGGARWIPDAGALPPGGRSLMLEVATRLVFHVIIVWSVYLLLAGHNHPGGGFAAGLVAGLGLLLRYLAGGRAELGAALPVVPGWLLGTGLFLSAGTGLVSLLAGGEVLQTWTYDLHLGPVGELHLVSSVAFDVGVYLVVVGLLLDLLSSLGSALDRDAQERGDHTGRASAVLAGHEEEGSR